MKHSQSPMVADGGSMMTDKISYVRYGTQLKLDDGEVPLDRRPIR